MHLEFSNIDPHWNREMKKKILYVISLVFHESIAIDEWNSCSICFNTAGLAVSYWNGYCLLASLLCICFEYPPSVLVQLGKRIFYSSIRGGERSERESIDVREMTRSVEPRGLVTSTSVWRALLDVLFFQSEIPPESSVARAKLLMHTSRAGERCCRFSLRLLTCHPRTHILHVRCLSDIFLACMLAS